MNIGRHYLWTIVISLGFLLPAAGLAVDRKTFLAVDQEISRLNPELIKIRRYLHMNPELSFQETATSNILRSKLAAQGLEIKAIPPAPGFAAILRGPSAGPVVALAVAMDGLPLQEKTGASYTSLKPGLMHAGGNDIHMTISLGTALVLQVFRDKLQGTVKFIFQPGSPSGPAMQDSGAKLMINNGVLQNPQVGAVLGIQVVPFRLGDVQVSAGPVTASSERFLITIQGRASSAGQPQAGQDAVAIASQVISSLQQVLGQSRNPDSPTVLTIGQVRAGTHPALVAEQARLEGTVLILGEGSRQKVRRIIGDAVGGVTQAFGATSTVTYLEEIPPIVNHPQLTKNLTPVLTELLGVRHVHPARQQMFAEDFAWFAGQVPGYFVFLGSQPSTLLSAPPPFSPAFNPDERSISLGTKVMSHLILECLEQQELWENRLP
jgi:amidohydrolase